ncbi:MAG: phosphoribosyltransferase family protein [Pseudonocardiaceae bacterium]
MIRRVSLFQLSPENGKISPPTGAGFDATEYSRFKYGDAEMAELYAIGLVGLLRDLGGSIMRSGQPPVITTAPFKFIPTASFQLAQQIQRHLYAVLSSTWESPINLVPLYMRNVDADNYSARNQLERKKILDQAGLYVDPEGIRGKDVLLIDDAIVSGTAEQEATRVLTVAGASSVSGAYVVEIDQDYGRRHPEIEDELNHAFVRDLGALLEVFQTAPIKLNIRTVKFVLGWPERSAVERFFKRITPAQLAQFSRAVAEDENSFAKSYPDTVKILTQTSEARRVSPERNY